MTSRKKEMDVAHWVPYLMSLEQTHHSAWDDISVNQQRKRAQWIEIIHKHWSKNNTPSQYKHERQYFLYIYAVHNVLQHKIYQRNSRLANTAWQLPGGGTIRPEFEIVTSEYYICTNVNFNSEIINILPKRDWMPSNNDADTNSESDSDFDTKSDPEYTCTGEEEFEEDSEEYEEHVDEVSEQEEENGEEEEEEEEEEYEEDEEEDEDDFYEDKEEEDELIDMEVNNVSHENESVLVNKPGFVKITSNNIPSWPLQRRAIYTHKTKQTSSAAVPNQVQTIYTQKPGLVHFWLGRIVKLSQKNDHIGCLWRYPGWIDDKGDILETFTSYESGIGEEDTLIIRNLLLYSSYLSFSGVQLLVLLLLGNQEIKIKQNTFTCKEKRNVLSPPKVFQPLLNALLVFVPSKFQTGVLKEYLKRNTQKIGYMGSPSWPTTESVNHKHKSLCGRHILLWLFRWACLIHAGNTKTIYIWEKSECPNIKKLTSLLLKSNMLYEDKNNDIRATEKISWLDWWYFGRSLIGSDNTTTVPGPLTGDIMKLLSFCHTSISSAIIHQVMKWNQTYKYTIIDLPHINPMVFDVIQQKPNRKSDVTIRLLWNLLLQVWGAGYAWVPKKHSLWGWTIHSTERMRVVRELVVV
jgi:hypothetical protein